MSYIKESKKVFIELYTWLLAHEIYLNRKYHKKHNDSIKVICNTCLNSGWVLSEKEKHNLIKNAIEIAEKEYGIVEVENDN